MKVECEINWVEGNIEEVILNRIVHVASEKMLGEWYEKVEKDASSQLAQAVDELINKMINRFMDKEIVVTDAWGEVQEKHESVNALMKTKFDAFLTGEVDEKGMTRKSCSYGPGKTRIDYLIALHISHYGERVSRDIERKVEMAMREFTEKKIHEAALTIVKKLELKK